MSLNLSVGWNMISSFGYNNSLSEMLVNSPEVLDSITAIFGYNQGYTIVGKTDSLVQGSAYFIYSTTEYSNITLNLTSRETTVNFALNPGWNMVGCVFDEDFSLLTFDDDSVISAVFGFSTGYTIVSTTGDLVNGSGYWVYSTSSSIVSKEYTSVVPEGIIIEFKYENNYVDIYVQGIPDASGNVKGIDAFQFTFASGVDTATYADGWATTFTNANSSIDAVHRWHDSIIVDGLLTPSLEQGTYSLIGAMQGAATYYPPEELTLVLRIPGYASFTSDDIIPTSTITNSSGLQIQTGTNLAIPVLVSSDPLEYTNESYQPIIVPPPPPGNP
tara:strand:+ start:519 stop:1508 length:990 start_codon:yes stop_codon:yes gene_type:complete